MVPIDYFDSAASEHLGAVAMIDDDVSLTFADLSRMSHQIAHAIDAITADGRPVPVVIYSPNDHRVLIAALGVMRAGGVIVPVHAGNPLEVTKGFLQAVQPRCAFYHSSLARQVALLRRELPTIVQWICVDRALADDVSLDALCTGGRVYSPQWIDASGNRDRPVYYWATSGTSGEPKIVIDDVASFEGALR